MRKRFPFFRVVLVALLLGGTLFYFFFLPQETVFSDQVFSRFTKRDQADFPDRPLRREDVSAALDAQLQKAGLPPVDLPPDDVRLTASLPVFAAYAAQVINRVDRTAGDLTDVPAEKELQGLNAAVDSMLALGERWDKRVRVGSTESASARNICKWAQILREDILDNWRDLRAGQPFTPVALAAFKKAAENTIRPDQGFNAVFRFELGPGLKANAAAWLETVNQIEAIEKEPADLSPLLRIHRDETQPQILRDYAASVYRAGLPLPSNLAALQLELTRSETLPHDPAYAGFLEFFAGRKAFLLGFGELVQKYQVSPVVDEVLLQQLEATMATSPAPKPETDFVAHLKALAVAVREAQTTEEQLQDFTATGVKQGVAAWTGAVEAGKFFDELAVYPKSRLAPFQTLAHLLDESATEYSRPEVRWAALEECRQNYFNTSSRTWRKLFHVTRRLWAPLTVDRDALQREARELNDGAETKWAATFGAFLQARDELPRLFHTIDQLQNVELVGMGQIRPETLESREAIACVKQLGELRSVTNEIVEAEEVAPGAVLDEGNVQIYLKIEDRLTRGFRTLRALLKTPGLEAWEKTLDDHVQAWERVMKLAAAKNTAANPTTVQVDRLTRLLGDGAAGREARWSEFVAAVRFEKTDFVYSPELDQFVSGQQTIAKQLEGLSTRWSRPLLHRLAALHTQTAAAAQAYGALNRESGFVRQEIEAGVTSTVLPPAWQTAWNDPALAWWKERRVESEAAWFLGDFAGLIEFKFTGPVWEKNYPGHNDAWVNRALPGVEYEQLGSAAEQLKARIKTAAGAAAGQALTRESDAFQSAQELEGAGSWVDAQRAYQGIAATTVRSAAFKEARLKRLALLAAPTAYAIPVGTPVMFQTDFKEKSAFASSVEKGFGWTVYQLIPESPAFATVNDDPRKNWVFLKRLTPVTDPKRGIAESYVFRAVDPFEFTWTGGSPLDVAFSWTTTMYGKDIPAIFGKPTKSATVPAVALHFTGIDALFQLCTRLGLTPAQVGFPYLIPDKVVVGKIVARNWHGQKKEFEEEIHQGQELLQKSLLDPPSG